MTDKYSISKQNIQNLWDHYNNYIKDLVYNDKVYILHFKDYTPWYIHPISWLIEFSAKIEGRTPVMHTAIIYKILQDPLINTKEIFITESTGGVGVGIISLWNKLSSFKGKIWLEEIPNEVLDVYKRLTLIDFVEEKNIGTPYNALSAVLSFLDGMFDRIKLKTCGSYYCTHYALDCVDVISDTKLSSIFNFKNNETTPSDLFDLNVGKKTLIYDYNNYK